MLMFVHLLSFTTHCFSFFDGFTFVETNVLLLQPRHSRSQEVQEVSDATNRKGPGWNLGSYN